MKRATIFWTVLCGCSTAALSPAARNVVPLAAAPPSACQNLGAVIGQGGGAFGGAYVSNDSLMEYAMNDARNKAANLGATHVQLSAPQLGGASGTTTTATVMAVAYRCPPEANAPAASSVAPSR
ncbi:MAG: DUF4156 domain-containing protein [Myxococcales bacterium]